MDTMNMNQEMSQSTAPQQPMTPQKKSNKGWIAIVVIILAILALVFFGNKKMNTSDTTQNSAGMQDASDLSSIEAELDATAFEGVSEGL